MPDFLYSCHESRELEWDSSNEYKTDASLKSFLFTLKNPHDVPARRFALKAKMKDRAISRGSSRGSDFVDIRNSYTNDIGLYEEMFFTGSQYFKVKEIEVFEITG
jgi:hypothetical protein